MSDLKYQKISQHTGMIMKYRIAYRIAASVSRYVSYREVVHRCTPSNQTKS